MSIEDVIRNAPETANELVRKLADTSDGAVKTRQRLLAELRNEIELLIGRKEEHLFPILERQQETKKLVERAREGNERIVALLSELDAMEVTDKGFTKKVAELRRAFQSEMQSERKEAIPAIKKALGDEEAGEIADRMLHAAEEGSEQMRQGAQQTTEAAAEAGEALAATSEAVLETSEAVARSALRTAASAARQSAEGAETVISAGTASMPVMSRNLAERHLKATRDVALAWLEFVDKATGSSTRLARELPWAATPMKWASVTTRAGTELSGAWLDATRKIMGASARLSVELAVEAMRRR